MTIELSLAGQLRTLLVDSGSEVSILKQPIRNVSLLEPRLMATGVTGKALPIEGEQEVQWKWGEILVSHRFLIAEISTMGDGLVGLDLMSKLGVVLDARAKSVSTDREPPRKEGASCITRDQSDVGPAGARYPSIMVKAARRVEIPSYSEKMIEGRLKEKLAGEVIFESVPQPQQGIRLARSLNKPVGRQVWIRAINLSAEPIVIGKGQTLGIADTLALVNQVTIKTAGRAGGGYSVRDRGGAVVRTQLMRQKLTHLPLPDQEELLAVLGMYEQLFDEPDEIGCSLPIYHRIQKYEEGPIVKRPYRVPYSQREVVTEMVQEMLRTGVIEPSQSPWSAPVVLVQKKTQDGSVLLTTLPEQTHILYRLLWRRWRH